MKDIKSYVIGFLTCVCMFLIMGQTDKNQKEITADTIYAKNIMVVDFDNPEEFVQLKPTAIQVGLVDPKTIKPKAMCNMVSNGILIEKDGMNAGLLIFDEPQLSLKNKDKLKEIKP